MSINNFLELSRKSKKITIEHLCEITGLSYGVVHRVLTGESKKASFNSIKNVAEALNLDKQYLTNFLHFAYAKDPDRLDKFGDYKYPLISWEDLYEKMPLQEPVIVKDPGLEINHHQEIIDGFALCLDQHHHFLPFFEPGDFLVINPHRLPVENEFVLFKTQYSEHFVLGKFAIINNEAVLTSSKEIADANIIFVNEEEQPPLIIVIDKHLKNKRWIDEDF